MLFRPFVKLRFIGSETSPSSVCAQAADAVTTLVRSYDKLYTLQRTPSFVPYIVLASSISHLAMGREFGSGQILQGVRDLRDMRSCHGFSQRGLDIIRVLAQQWDMGDFGDEIKRESHDEREIVTVQDLCRPLTTRTNIFCPDMGDSFAGMGPMGVSALFSPFPMQGLPLLASDELLEIHGFSKM